MRICAEKDCNNDISERYRNTMFCHGCLEDRGRRRCRGDSPEIAPPRKCKSKGCDVMITHANINKQYCGSIKDKLGCIYIRQLGKANIRNQEAVAKKKASRPVRKYKLVPDFEKETVTKVLIK